MNILYLTQIRTTGWSGPTYSVPMQIKYQAKYDNVLWYHLRENFKSEWLEYCKFISIKDYPKGKINLLPEPFNKPDLIVVEQFYGYFKNLNIIKEIQKMDVPYILIPRGEFTEGAQKKSALKKYIANKFIFKKFAINANYIQYLTKREQEDSKKFINNKYIIISNGIEENKKIKKDFHKKKIICSNIGRIEMYQKGLDLLIDACALIKEDLISMNFILNIYGPDQEGQKKSLELKIKENKLENIIFLKDAIINEEKEKVLLKTDIFIMTSRFEGHPMALIEALSYGIPSVVTEGSNMAEEVEKFNAGWSCKVDVKEIAKTLKEAVKNKEEFYNKSKNALYLSKKYNWQEIAQNTHYEYEKILKK